MENELYRADFAFPHVWQHLDFRVEAFNALNHPQFGPPGSVQGTGTFGVVTMTNSDDRELRLALKYFF